MRVPSDSLERLQAPGHSATKSGILAKKRRPVASSSPAEPEDSQLWHGSGSAGPDQASAGRKLMQYLN